MKVIGTIRRAALVGASLALVGGCDMTAPEPSKAPEVQAEARALEPLHPERRGIGVLPLPQATGPSAQVLRKVHPRRSLIVTDEVILNRFPFVRIMDTLVAQSGVPGLTSLQLFQEWWDTARPAPGLGLGGPHCSDPGIADMNGFPYSCPRAEGNQALVNPFTNPLTNPDSYLPIALVNRFDLAPVDGANCGEYRIIYAKRSGITQPGNRVLAIFEAVLPNPAPAEGLEGCRAVAEHWASLTTAMTVDERAQKLEAFYFVGLPGFMPVVHIDNYGNRATNTGQVRTNQFMQPVWTLREFKLQLGTCGGAPCSLRFIPVTDKTNPGGTLFNPASVHPQAPAFQNTDFLSQVEPLAVNDVHRFSMSIADHYNSGQSHSQGVENHYVSQFGAGPSPFHFNIQNELIAIGSILRPQDVVARAMALSCAGCHQLSNNANLGGGITWPSSLGFVHVGEQTELGPDGPRFVISPALIDVFLPRRQALFEAFLNASCGDALCQPWESSTVCAMDCP